MVYGFHTPVLKNGDARYNCTIIDLYGRSAIASISKAGIKHDIVPRKRWTAILSARVRFVSVSKTMIKPL